MPSDSPPRNAVKQRAGLIGARARWRDHTPRVVSLNQLDPRVRAAVLALMRADEAARNEKAASGLETLAAKSEGHGNDRPTA